MPLKIGAEAPEEIERRPPAELERIKVRARDRADELYVMVKQMLDQATMSDELRFDAERLVQRIER
jgi:hypothetical protein